MKPEEIKIILTKKELKELVEHLDWDIIKVSLDESIITTLNKLKDYLVDCK